MLLELVIDANIVFSALLTDGTTRDLIFDSQLRLYAPEYLFSELNEHLLSDSELKRKLSQTNEETSIILHELLGTIQVLPLSDYRVFVKPALEICPDEFDVPYFALALSLKIPIWSNDKRLKKQNTIQIFDTRDLLDLLGEERFLG
jgi:predicted nucleic acid-binding protein